MCVYIYIYIFVYKILFFPLISLCCLYFLRTFLYVLGKKNVLFPFLIVRSFTFLFFCFLPFFSVSKYE